MGVAGMTLDETKSGEMRTASPRRKALQTIVRQKEEWIGRFEYSRRTGEEIRSTLRGLYPSIGRPARTGSCDRHDYGFRAQPMKGRGRQGGLHYTFPHEC